MATGPPCPSGALQSRALKREGGSRLTRISHNFKLNLSPCWFELPVSGAYSPGSRGPRQCAAFPAHKYEAKGLVPA